MSAAARAPIVEKPIVRSLKLVSLTETVKEPAHLVMQPMEVDATLARIQLQNQFLVKQINEQAARLEELERRTTITTSPLSTTMFVPGYSGLPSLARVHNQHMISVTLASTANLNRQYHQYLIGSGWPNEQEELGTSIVQTSISTSSRLNVGSSLLDTGPLQYALQDVESLPIGDTKNGAQLALSENQEPSPNQLSKQFSDLVVQWKRETMHISSISEAAMHPCYQRIIGLGPEAIPLVFAELRDHGGHWYWALRALTGLDPVPEDHRGKVGQMRMDWLKWGSENNFI